jgi:hypothetical protein
MRHTIIETRFSTLTGNRQFHLGWKPLNPRLKLNYAHNFSLMSMDCDFGCYLLFAIWYFSPKLKRFLFDQSDRSRQQAALNPEP